MSVEDTRHEFFVDGSRAWCVSRVEDFLEYGVRSPSFSTSEATSRCQGKREVTLSLS